MPESSNHCGAVDSPDMMRKTLHTIFADEPSVQAVYLFGSHASGRARSGSDVDLGVVMQNDASMPDKLDLLAALAARGMDHVDLIFLHRVDPVVRYEAVRPNVLVYRAKTFDRGSYYSRVVRQYLDVQPLLHRQRRAYKQHLLQEA
jgi:predicted nucleotidyltransferase